MIESELDKAYRDMIFELGYVIGMVWFIKRILGLKLKPEYQMRLDAKNKH